jgi:L-fuculose-phosphate aldolase
MDVPSSVKTEICEIGRRLYQRGLVSAYEGNISVRVGPDEVLCTPSQMCKGFLASDDLCTVNLRGEQTAGMRRRTSEILLHLVVYRERSDVRAVVHAHPPHVLAFALSGEPVPSGHLAEVEVFLGPVPTTPYDTPGTARFAETVTPFVRDATAIVLANHGSVTFGPTLADAWQKTEILDAYCRVLLLTRQLGTPRRLTEAQIGELLALKKRIGLHDPRL